MAAFGFDPDGDQEGARTSVELPDGSEAHGRLVETEGRWVLRLHGEKELEAGDEIGITAERYLTVTEVRRRRMDDFVVTELALRGPFLRPLEGHSLGDGWPQEYWFRLAARCEHDGFARPVVRFLERLGELRTSDQLGVARGWMDSLSAEHLATVTGQVGGALLNLERIGAPDDLVDDVASLYSDMVDELSERTDRGEFLQPPNPATRVRWGRHRPETSRTLRDWSDLIP